MNVLVVDVGGSHVKIAVTGLAEVRRFPSGKDLTAEECVSRVIEEAKGWQFDAISLGYPGKVAGTGPAAEPGNLGCGWVGFDFEARFGRPVRVANDAVMQALGGYTEGRMLFLGLGTGLGSALVIEHVVVPLELGTLPWSPHGTVADRVGRSGLERHGPQQWNDDVARLIEMLRPSFLADHVLLGGGNAEHVDPLPPAVRRGGNDDAFIGGFRLWEDVVEPHDRLPSRAWRVLP